MYVPIAHEGGGNYDKAAAIRWLKDMLEGSHVKIGANILYDIEWLKTEGISVGGPWIDIQGVDALIHEHFRSYSLESIAQRRLGQGKAEMELRQRFVDLIDMGVIKCRGELDNDFIKANMWRLHSRDVAAYAIEDARLPYQIWELQRKEVEAQKLERVLDLECRLLPALHAMRMLGTPISRERAMELTGTLARHEAGSVTALREAAGFEMNPRSPRDLKKAFDELGIQYPLTAKGNPNIDANFLKTNEDQHPIIAAILRNRKLTNLRSTFVQGMILGHHINERIYTSFHPLKSDAGGAVTGRFSSTNPNLQQVPKRGTEFSKQVRSLFVPEPGCNWWSFDYAQIEPRVLVHYSVLCHCIKAQAALGEYLDDPKTDYHTMVAKMAGIARDQAKTINLGIMYGMGQKKLSASLQLALDDARSLLDQYHERLPFVRQMARRTSAQANTVGHLITLGGRHERFPFWEPANFDPDRKIVPLPHDEAKTAWPSEVLRRARTFKALNSLIQGSAADIMKQAIVDAFENGYVPHITVHDELNFSLEKGEAGRKKAKEIKEIMEHAIRLEVPLLADAEVGDSWGEVKESGL